MIADQERLEADVAGMKLDIKHILTAQLQTNARLGGVEGRLGGVEGGLGGVESKLEAILDRLDEMDGRREKRVISPTIF